MVETADQAIKPVRAYAEIVIAKQKAKEDRFLLGIVGAPAAGKSTFAANLVQELNQIADSEIAIVVPMDGFHYSNEELTKRGLLALKGIPATFDAHGFVQLIKEIKIGFNKSIFGPLFDRSIEASIPEAIEVKPRHSIIVCEGNYLLLEDAPWCELRDQFDCIWYIDANIETLMPRLTARHKEGGRNELQTQEKIENTDLPNAKLIHSTRNRADKIIKLY